MKSPIKPLADRIIVLRDKPSNETDSGLLLPSEEDANTGTIIAIGEQVLDTDNIQVGDRCAFPLYGGQQVMIDRKEFIILREDELFGTFKGE